MGSTKPQVITDNQRPALANLRKQSGHGWWEQFVPGADLIGESEGGRAQTLVNDDGTITLRVEDIDGEARARTMMILEGFKGGKVELSARFSVNPVPDSETADVILVALGQPLGQSTFTTPGSGDQVGDVIGIDDETPDDIQEIRAVFETGLADGDNLAVGIILKKTSNSNQTSIDVAGLQVAQIFQQSVPRGGNR